MIEGKLMNGVIVFLNKLGAAATATVVAIALLLGAGSALAATVVKVGDVATGILDLTLGSQTYDVYFPITQASNLYPRDQFDFDTAVEASNAANAVVTVLNAEGDVLAVGDCSLSPCDSLSPQFEIPYASFMKTFDPQGFPPLGPFDIPFLKMEYALTGDQNNPGVWWVDSAPNDGAKVTSRRYAKFTLTSSGGPGNTPPVADAGGSYTGSAGFAVSFDGRDSSDLDGIIDTYTWKFGDGDEGTGPTPNHVYAVADTYNVTLTVTDDAGDSGSDSTTAVIVPVGEPPQADAGGPYIGAVGFPVTFDGSDSSDDGETLSYDWDFGDASPTGSGVSPTHIYLDSGKYSVRLTLTDDDNNTDSDTAAVTIGTGSIPPIADAGGPYLGDVGVAVRFDATGSSSPSGNIVSYEWNFGDGSTGVGAGPLHTYASATSYTASVTVTTDDDQIDSASTTVIVVDEVPPRSATDIIDMPDVNGNSSADVAVVFEDAERQSIVQIRDGSDGSLIRELNYTDTLTLAIGAVEIAGQPPGIAVMYQQTEAPYNVVVQVRSADTGAFVNDVSFGSTYTGVDMTIIPDKNGNGIDEAVVVGEDDNQGVRVLVKDLLTEEKLGAVFHGSGVDPMALETMPDLNNDGAAEVALLERTRSNNKFRVWVIDTEAQAVLTNIDYGFGGFEAVAMAVVPATAAADTGVALSMLRSSDNTGKLVTKNALTGTNLSNIQYNKVYVPVDLATVADTNGNGTLDLALMEQSAAKDVRIRVFDSATGAQTNSMPMQKLDSARALAAIDDVNGNGSSEAAAFGPGGNQFRIHAKDSQDQSGIFFVDLP
jgi:PKD repeat protein